MRWDYLFGRQILSRGREYFENKCVQDLMHRGATYQARVAGTSTYHVEVYLTDRVHPKMYCDCPYAADGNHCKHMAAVLYAIEESERQESEQIGKRVQDREKKPGANELMGVVYGMVSGCCYNYRGQKSIHYYG